MALLLSRFGSDQVLVCCCTVEKQRIPPDEPPEWLRHDMPNGSNLDQAAS